MLLPFINTQYPKRYISPENTTENKVHICKVSKISASQCLMIPIRAISTKVFCLLSFHSGKNHNGRWCLLNIKLYLHLNIMILNFAAYKNMLAQNVLLSMTGLNINGSVNSAFMSTVQLRLQLQGSFSKEVFAELSMQQLLLWQCASSRHCR